VNGKEVLGSIAAIFDTGTTLIVGDPDGIKKFMASVPESKLAPEIGDGFYTSALRDAVT
jgi:hypothetical protein